MQIIISVIKIKEGNTIIIVYSLELEDFTNSVKVYDVIMYVIVYDMT